MLWGQARLDREDNLVCVLGVLREVGGQKMQRVVLRRAVEVTTVPEVASDLKRGLHGRNSIFDWGWSCAPREAHEMLVIGFGQCLESHTHEAEASLSNIFAEYLDHFQRSNCFRSDSIKVVKSSRIFKVRCGVMKVDSSYESLDSGRVNVMKKHDQEGTEGDLYSLRNTDVL